MGIGREDKIGIVVFGLQVKKDVIKPVRNSPLVLELDKFLPAFFSECDSA